MNVIYEDDSLIVIDKPAGIAVQTAGVGTKDLETELKKYRKANGEKPEIFVVHRLDQPVSGLLVLAKTKEAAAVLSREMQNAGYIKDYRATVYSKDVNLENGTLTDYMIKDTKTSMAVIVSKDNKEAKKAILDYEVTDRTDCETRIIVHLHTGRFHQIRAQLANLGTPILGDRKYGSSESISYSDGKGIKNVSLDAYHLSFKHPVTGKMMDFAK